MKRSIISKNLQATIRISLMGFIRFYVLHFGLEEKFYIYVLQRSTIYLATFVAFCYALLNYEQYMDTGEHTITFELFV